jgi:hypothetical protein
MSDTLTRPEQYAEHGHRWKRSARIRAMPCFWCVHGTGFHDAAKCREFLDRTYKQCAEDGMQPKFELNEEGQAELEKTA